MGPVQHLSSNYGIYSLTNQAWITQCNIQKKIYPASITKLITALVVLDYFDVKEKIIVDYAPKVPRYRADLQLGHAYTIEELLNGLLIKSMNDIAMILATHTEKRTQQLWHQLAKKKLLQIGMHQSSFINPHGLHNKLHFTTISDLVILGLHVYQNQTIMNILQKPKCKLFHKSKKYKIYSTTNVLLNKNGVIAGKTGYTPKAGKCFLFFFQKNSQIYLAVFAKSEKKLFKKTIQQFIKYVK
ncbi:hypothetical protein BHU72_03940 [Desulfuribacillus stibiiarsenatis]|uniref:Peptidase S11 D-alanyl-D-alanine carboxypeptidase A N-terminal domain-containing protein n=1 Tax=Desulfuribacillus stibiiarsenatis TaxID=1390249 RepID=A0A1E5L6Z6_9FIRM|nr:D-alanyl-D-alanine carboxypeptidase [Desulfuribacillus stibiiarsenatis]OEH85930.1 hypothetical protein BHU72_03940 [Desulfuribacillus stibiiarsenatis]